MRLGCHKYISTRFNSLEMKCQRNMTETEGPNKTSEAVTMTSYEIHPCRRCPVIYNDYKQLLSHLYWRHGTESRTCNKCLLRKWTFAAHVCNILPIEELLVLEDVPSPDADTDIHCTCRRYLEDSSMIACDGPDCEVQWYHFKCVGITIPPDGQWFCDHCRATIVAVGKY